MLKIEYFNFCLFLGVQRSIQVSGRWRHHYIYSVNVRGSFKLSTGEGTVLPRGRHAPGYPKNKSTFEFSLKKNGNR